MIVKNRHTLTAGFVVLPLVLLLGLTVKAALPQSTGLTEQQRILHVLNRLGYGPKPGDVRTIQAMGIERYIEQQLNPQSLPYSNALNQELDSLQTRKLSPVELFQQYGPPLKKLAKKNGATKESNAELLKEIREKSRMVVLESGEARLDRAINSPRQLEEVMTDFWFNHFNVYVGKGATYVWVGHYEDHAIRPYVFGRFRDLLEATAKHPAMLFYLDNWLNTAPGSPGARGRFTGLNENYARELLELHTLGVDGGYTQKDVTELARVLTGWSIVNRQAYRRNNPMNPAQGVYFDAARHDFGAKVVLGKTIPGTGASELKTVLGLLARHPATAHHISYQLAQAFVSDRPSESLVNRLEQQYLATDGNIRGLLQTIFYSPEFWSPESYQAKFKTPYQYLISMMRVAGVNHLERPQLLLGLLKKEGMPLYGCQPPTGYKNTQDAWLSPDAMTQRTNLATGFAVGRLPVSVGMLDAQSLLDTLGAPPSPQLQAALDQSNPRLRPALILGSPDFMNY